MSHTTSISSIVIADTNALRLAIAELKAEGIKCDLLENAKPRAYYENQAGLGVAPLVIQLHDARYDVGLYMNEKIGGYEARTDLYGGSVAKVLGNQHLEGVPNEQTSLGKLYQRYAVCAAEQQALMQGFSPSREYNAQTGDITLTLMVA